MSFGAQLDGDRVIGTAYGTLRVLRHDSESPPGRGPHGLRGLGVDNAGRVLAIGVDQVWHLTEGRVDVDEPVSAFDLNVWRRDDSARYALLTMRQAVLHDVGHLKSVPHWKLPEWFSPVLASGWLGSGTDLVVSTFDDELRDRVLLRGSGGELQRVVTLDKFAQPLGADPMSDALVVAGGRVYVVRVRDG